MTYLKLRKDINRASKKIFKGGQREGKRIIKEEAKQARKVLRRKYPHNLGLHLKDVNHLTDF